MPLSSCPAPPILLASMCQFLTSVGIDTQESSLPEDTFLPGLLIEKGRLLIDPAQLLYPGDVLHEAGHIAVTTAAERPYLGGNITENKPEKEGEEMAAMLWSYAASRTLGIPPEVVFHPQGYKNQSAWLLDNYQRRVYIGLPLLVWMGLTTTDTFPEMECWLRT